MEPFTVPVLQVEVPNQNNHVYSLETAVKIVERYQTPLPCEMDMPIVRQHGTTGLRIPPTELDRVSHIVEKLEVVGDQLMATIRPLDTQMGKVMQQLLSEIPDTKENYRMAGYGTFHRREDGTYEVINYQMTGIHLTSNPA